MTYLGDTMKSNLKLYKVEFKPELNPLVENLESYLADCDKTTYGDFQYIKHDLNIVVKIPMSQEFVDEFPFNYAAIKNSDSDDTFYYYVMNVSWVAQNTIALTLGMDTVNTFGQTGSLGNPANFTDETHIYRQHGDRFYDTGQRDQAGGKLLRRRIDREAEGFDVPKQLTSSTIQRDAEFGSDKWALMFKTGIEGGIDVEGPLDVFLVPEEPYAVRVAGNTGSVIWNVAAFEVGVYYYMVGSENPGAQFIATDSAGTSRSYTVPSNGYIVINAQPGTYDTYNMYFSVLVMKDDGDKAVQDGTWWTSYKTIEFLSGSKLRYGTSGPTSTSPFTKITYLKTSAILSTYGAYVSISPNVATSTLKTLKEVDHYDSKIVKIINLPYCPLDITRAPDGTYAVPEGWEISEGYLKWGKNLLPNLTRENATNFTRNLVDYWYPSAKQSKETARESKLFHSEFFTWTAVYDSFAKEIALERFDLSETDPGRITVDFKQTNTLGNNALFKFNFDDFAPYETVENYEQYMLVDRNNEEPIFTSDYVNYLRSGYQYDVAANKIAANRALTEAITSTVGAAVNVGTTVYNKWQPATEKNLWQRITKDGTPGRQYTNNPDVVKKGGNWQSVSSKTTPAGFHGAEGLVFQNTVNSALNATSSWMNYSNLLKEQKLQMSARLADLQMRSVSVSGSGTIDLLEEYNGNALNVMIYEPRLTIKRRLYEFFDYFGYNHDYYEVPNISSRYWYNYLQCSPMLAEEGFGKYKEVWLEDLKARYEVGVVVFHERNGEWNFKRRWENWETWVITE